MLFGKRERVVKRILIVEDEPLVAFDNEVTLADLGYEVVATLDGFDDAIATLDKEEVDLVLSDLRIRSAQSGLDLARAAKERGIPVLFSTGFDLPEEAKSISVGCLKKPHTERQLKNALEAVDRMLAGKKAKTFKGFDLYPETGS